MPLLVFVSLVPLGLALHNASRTQSFLYAYATGFLGWLMLTPGLIVGLSSYTHVSLLSASLLVIIACAWLALPYGVFGFLYGKFRWMNGHHGALKTAACLTLLVSFFPSPLPLDSSHSLYMFPRLLQLMDLGGQPLLLFIVYLFNWFVVDIMLKLKERTSCKPALAWILGLTILIVGYSSFRLMRYHHDETQQASTPGLKIALIQPNVPLTSDSHLHTLNALQTLVTQSLEVLSREKSVDLIVWPEVSARIDCDSLSQTTQEMMTAAHGASFLINCTQLTPPGRDYNTQLFISADGTTRAYHKQILFPFTESIPGEQLFPELRTLMPGVSRYDAGTDASVFLVKDFHVFTGICYEILFPNHPRKFLQYGGNILISPANDAWFGTNRIPDFEVAAAVFQAVQYRIPVVRVSNSGNSVAVKATGEIVSNSRTPNFVRMSRLVEVFAPAEQSAYYRFGNLFLYLLACIWSLSLVSNIWKSRVRGAQQ